MVYAVNKGEKIARERNYQLLELVAVLPMDIPIFVLRNQDWGKR